VDVTTEGIDSMSECSAYYYGETIVAAKSRDLNKEQYHQNIDN